LFAVRKNGDANVAPAFREDTGRHETVMYRQVLLLRGLAEGNFFLVTLVACTLEKDAVVGETKASKFKHGSLFIDSAWTKSTGGVNPGCIYGLAVSANFNNA